jgi:hypothetical protein
MQAMRQRCEALQADARAQAEELADVQMRAATFQAALDEQAQRAAAAQAGLVVAGAREEELQQVRSKCDMCKRQAGHSPVVALLWPKGWPQESCIYGTQMYIMASSCAGNYSLELYDTQLKPDTPLH